MGDLDHALADYDEAIRLDPDYAEVYRERGWVWALKDDYVKAMADLDHAVEHLKSEPTTWMRRGDARHARAISTRPSPTMTKRFA